MQSLGGTATIVVIRLQMVKTDLQEVGCESMDWIKLAQDMDNWRAIVNAVMKLRGPIKCGGLLKTG
jgi:hypothetical protein